VIFITNIEANSPALAVCFPLPGSPGALLKSAPVVYSELKMALAQPRMRCCGTREQLLVHTFISHLDTRTRATQRCEDRRPQGDSARTEVGDTNAGGKDS
jgi:hypothetical protein